MRGRRVSWLKRLASQIFRDIGVHQVKLAAVDGSIGVLEIAPALAQALHLRPGERDPGLEGFEDLVVEAGAAVLDDHLAGAGAPFGTAFLRHCGLRVS